MTQQHLLNLRVGDCYKIRLYGTEKYGVFMEYDRYLFVPYAYTKCIDVEPDYEILTDYLFCFTKDDGQTEVLRIQQDDLDCENIEIIGCCD